MDTSTAILWTDSTVSLGWIKSNPNRRKTFVCNRVTEVQKYTNPIQWRHCSGKLNPADVLSRGISSANLQNHTLWWNGPDFLTEPSETWPTDDMHSKKILPEARRQGTEIMHISTHKSVIDFSRFSSYRKLLRTTAWIFRFIANALSHLRNTREFTSLELENAKNYLIRESQRNSFPDEIRALENNQPLPKKSKLSRFNPFLQDGLIRLGGRLQFLQLSSSEKHPLLLDGSDTFTKLLIRYTHLRLHHLGVRITLSEIRSEFWILQGRQVIKKVLHKCLPCKIFRQKKREQIEAPLPADRVNVTKPFHITGIDFAGPLYVRKYQSVGKAYIALFTCGITRALHLELVSDLSTDKFLMSLQRFVGHRGLPQVIYSDNATTFHAANRELTEIWKLLSASDVQRFYAEHGISWKFIAPRAAWWEGWWERMVGTVKRCLCKSIGKSCLEEESLSTVLIGIEAALNSRPIVYDYGIDDQVEALTPAHFLIGQRLTTIPTSAETKGVALIRLWKNQQALLNSFWRRWKKEYLLDLRNYHEVRNTNKQPNIRDIDVVLLQEEHRPRQVWKRALVPKLIPGRDGIQRTCHLRCEGKTIACPIQLVIPLEIDQGGENVKE